MSKRIVVGVDAVWDFELELNDPSLDSAPMCGDTSSEHDREEGEASMGYRARRDAPLLAKVEINCLFDDMDEDIAPALYAKRQGGLTRGPAVFQKG